MPGGQVVRNNTTPGPGTPTRVPQQFDSDLIVINEADIPFFFSSLGFKWKCSGTIISVKRMSRPLLLHKWDGHFFASKCNQRFLRYGLIREEDLL
jgi:hypothetical protein